MDTSYSTTSFHVKGKHLSYENRVLIQIRLKDNYSIRAIAREIGCSPSTVSNKIARGSVTLYNGHGSYLACINRSNIKWLRYLI